MAAHTSGPWEWNDRGQLIAVAAADSNDEDAPPVVIVETDGGFYGPRGADRDLLAAAPELLAALKSFVYPYQLDEKTTDTERQQAGRAAIIKAIGAGS